MVGIAQLVEHLVVVQDVAGSSPVTHPTKMARPEGLAILLDAIRAGLWGRGNPRRKIKGQDAAAQRRRDKSGYIRGCFAKFGGFGRTGLPTYTPCGAPLFHATLTGAGDGSWRVECIEVGAEPSLRSDPTPTSIAPPTGTVAGSSSNPGVLNVLRWGPNPRCARIRPPPQLRPRQDSNLRPRD